MIRIFEAQRLISLTDIFRAGGPLESLAKGEKVNTALDRQDRLAHCRNSTAAHAPERHREERSQLRVLVRKAHRAQRKLNLRALIDRAATDPKKLDEIRGLLAPFLRDTLVGFNYVHYAPPGAQVLYTNPLFVRSHDFIGMPGTNQTWKSTEVVRHRLAIQRRWKAGRLARQLCPMRWPKPNRIS